MAELNGKNNTPQGKKRRARQVAPNVDLTAMVDLAFLLITFFMLTTSLNKSNSLDMAMPSNEPQSTVDMDERRVVSLLIGEGTVHLYHGNFEQPLKAPTEVLLTKTELRAALAEFKAQIPRLTDGKDAVVLLKPSKDARALDIIQTLDELKISGVQRYMMSKISVEEERSMLAAL